MSEDRLTATLHVQSPLEAIQTAIKLVLLTMGQDAQELVDWIDAHQDTLDALRAALPSIRNLDIGMCALFLLVSLAMSIDPDMNDAAGWVSQTIQ